MTAIPTRRDQPEHVRELDWLMLVTTALCCLGLVMAVSIDGFHAEVGPLLAMQAQGTKLLFGLVVFMLAAMAPLEWLRRCAVPLLVVAVILCVVTLFFPNSHGARRWIREE